MTFTIRKEQRSSPELLDYVKENHYAEKEMANVVLHQSN